jgi:hypothetical protein
VSGLTGCSLCDGGTICTSCIIPTYFIKHTNNGCVADCITDDIGK